MLDFVDKIKDPIWNWIPVTQVEQEITDSSAFTRMRHVKQMSMAYVTYAGANHTRYEHSIGTMHVASRICEAIHKIREFYGDRFEIALQCLRLAALLHDVGHPPFSHAVEWTFKINPTLSPLPKYSHDAFTRRIIEGNSELVRTVAKYVKWINKGHYYKGHRFRIEEDDLQKGIAALAIGDEGYILALEDDFVKSLHMLIPILNGDLDADKIDYILRDNYHCGFPTGVDFDEVLDAFDLFVHTDDPAKNKLLLRRRHLSTVETLLHARLKLIDLIHHETKNRIANQMLMRTVARIVKDFDDGQREEIVTKMHEKWRDGEMLNFILSQSTKGSWGMRLFREQILSHSTRLDLPSLPPITRRNLYLISKNPESLLRIQEGLEETLGEELHLDLCFINPPPLTLQLSEGTEGRRPYLYDASNIIRGILLESFSRSFVAVYSDSPKIEETAAIRERLVCLVDNVGDELRGEVRSEESITCGDLVMCILAGVDRFASENLDRLPVWTYSIGRFQRFVSRLLEERIAYDMTDLEDLERGYDPRFYREVQQLVFCGLADEREKEITYDVPPIYYSRRLDYRINSFGIHYFDEYLKPHYKDLADEVVELLVNVREPIKKCIECDVKADKIAEYDKFVKEVKKHSREIEKGGGCVLVV